ncbi:hypothetical protein [Amycolatopsis sp. lyj-108]|uniref:hypothetical protein n=1 Tax=Amycolatopsis sp. lyj-108 TaxID=2789286 RepID=UPI003978D2BA
MTTSHDTTNGVTMDLDGLERAAQALATANTRPWGNADVRNLYRGLALAAVGAYLTSPADTPSQAGEQS